MAKALQLELWDRTLKTPLSHREGFRSIHEHIDDQPGPDRSFEIIEAEAQTRLTKGIRNRLIAHRRNHPVSKKR